MATAPFQSLYLSPPSASSAATVRRRFLPSPQAFFPSASSTTRLCFSPLRRHPSSRARPLIVVSALGKLSETELLSVPSDPQGFKDAEISTGAGVYGVYDSTGTLQFVGISRNIAGSVLSHKKALPDLCISVKVGLIDDPAPDSNVLTEAWKSWMQEHIDSTGRIPPGNETGNTTWQRRQQRKPDLRLTPGRHVQLTVPLEDLIDRLVKENKVVTFIKGSRNSPQCGFSQKVVGILNSHGVDYESVNVLDEEYNYGLREKLKQYSNWPTFPQIFFKGELIGGCDILSAMEEKGEISRLLDN